MSLITPSPIREALRHELSELRGNWPAFFALGVLTILLGLMLIAAPWVGTFAAVWVLSVLLIVGGILEFVGAFWARRWSGFSLALLAGVLYVAVGILIIDQPVEAAAAITLVIAALLVIGGIFRIAVALSVRFDGWGWPLVSGIIALLLGILIWRQWPDSSLWVIGLFLGIEFFFTGTWWVTVSLALRKLPKEPAAPKAPPASGPL